MLGSHDLPEELQNLDAATVEVETQSATIKVTLALNQPLDDSRYSIAAQLGEHSVYESTFLEGLSFRRIDTDGYCWSAQGQRLPDEYPEVIYLMTLQVQDRRASASANDDLPDGWEQTLPPGKFCFAKPAALDADTSWPSGPTIVQGLKDRRDALIFHEHRAPSSHATDPHWYVAVLVQDLFLTKPVYFPGTQVAPLDEDFTHDLLKVRASVMMNLGKKLNLRAVFGELQKDKGTPRWPYAIAIVPAIKAPGQEEALNTALEHLTNVVDVLNVHRGTRATLGTALIAKYEPGTTKNPVFQALEELRPGYSGFYGAAMWFGEGSTVLNRHFGALELPHLRLWTGQVSDAMGEQRWEYRHLRFYGVLEAIARRSISDSQPVFTVHGEPFCLQKDKQLVAEHPRAKIFQLLTELEIPETGFVTDGVQWTPNRWTLLGLWKDVRDVVAHTGAWQEDLTIIKKSKWDSHNERIQSSQGRMELDHLESLVLQLLRLTAAGRIK